MGNSLLKSRLESRNSAATSQNHNPAEEDEFVQGQRNTAVFHSNENKQSNIEDEQKGASRLQKLKNKNLQSLRSEADIEREKQALEEELLQQEILKNRREKRRKARLSKTTKIATVLLVIGCVYLVFLIYGAFNTDYVYDSTGNVIPQSMSIATLKTKKEFETVSMQYLQARSIYETVLLLDYRMGAGQEDQLLLATEYEKTLDSINSLTLQLDALQQSVPAEYSQVIMMLTVWTGTHIAAYCQNMSAAISQNNPEYANQAVNGREVVYNDFSLITKNIATLGSQVEGCEAIVADISSWSPEGYIQEKVGYITG